MSEINRNQILEIKVHQERKDVSSSRIAAFIDGPKQIKMSFIDGSIDFEKPVYFMGCEFLITVIKGPLGDEINYTYYAESTGDCSVVEDFLKTVHPEQLIVKKDGKAGEDIGDGKINMEKEYPTTTPITDIEEIKKALASIGPNGAFFDSAIDKNGAEIKLGDTIIITAKKFLHAYPIGTVCKVQGIYTNENPYEWHKDGKNLTPDYDIKINAWNDHYGGYQLYEGKYEKVFLFDAEVEINALKARIEALETALQRVPYAAYDKAVKTQTKDDPITITEITWKDLQATFIDGSYKAGPSFTINTYLHIGFKYSGYLNKGDLVKYQIGVKNADGTGTVLDFIFRVTEMSFNYCSAKQYNYHAVSVFAVTDDIKELFGKI